MSNDRTAGFGATQAFDKAHLSEVEGLRSNGFIVYFLWVRLPQHFEIDLDSAIVKNEMAVLYAKKSVLAARRRG